MVTVHYKSLEPKDEKQMVGLRLRIICSKLNIDYMFFSSNTAVFFYTKHVFKEPVWFI